MDISTKNVINRPIFGIHVKPGMVIKIWADRVYIILTVIRKPAAPTVEIIGLIDGKLVRVWLNNWTEYSRYVQI